MTLSANRRIKLFIACFALFIFALTFYSWYKAEAVYTQQHQNEVREQIHKHLLKVRDQLEHNLASDLQLAKGLVASISVNPQMEQQQFERLAETLFKEDSILNNIAAAPGMKIRLMYPVEGNEAAIGLDYRSLPAQFRTAELARKTRKTVLAGPIDLVQGGSAFIARIPVYLRKLARQRPGRTAQ